jgi:hypothetical protein
LFGFLGFKNFDFNFEFDLLSLFNKFLNFVIPVDQSSFGLGYSGFKISDLSNLRGDFDFSFDLVFTLQFGSNR